MTKDIKEIIRESGAQPGDLIYVRSSTGAGIANARLTTAPDLLGLKLEAIKDGDQPLVATGPGTDETFADVVIDATESEPVLVKNKSNGQTVNPEQTAQAAEHKL